MRSRPASRLLILDPSGRVLLFRFVHTRGALAGQDYWATPGGAVEDGETFEQAALRELREETGIVVDSPGTEIGCRTFVLSMPDGEEVLADERFFLIRPLDVSLSRDGWTAQERDLMTEHRWWSCDELRTTTDIVWPKTIPEMIERVFVILCAKPRHAVRPQYCSCWMNYLGLDQ